jgi:hypothetical protein
VQTDQVPPFLGDLAIPFDNNQAALDLRGLKVQRKDTDRFRGDRGADAYATSHHKPGVTGDPLYAGRVPCGGSQHGLRRLCPPSTRSALPSMVSEPFPSGPYHLPLIDQRRSASHLMFVTTVRAPFPERHADADRLATSPSPAWCADPH